MGVGVGVSVGVGVDVGVTRIQALGPRVVTKTSLAHTHTHAPGLVDEASPGRECDA